VSDPAHRAEPRPTAIQLTTEWFMRVDPMPMNPLHHLEQRSP
jgi:hypothetical protein